MTRTCPSGQIPVYNENGNCWVCSHSDNARFVRWWLDNKVSTCNGNTTDLAIRRLGDVGNPRGIELEREDVFDLMQEYTSMKLEQFEYDSVKDILENGLSTINVGEEALSAQKAAILYQLLGNAYQGLGMPEGAEHANAMSARFDEVAQGQGSIETLDADLRLISQNVDPDLQNLSAMVARHSIGLQAQMLEQSGDQISAERVRNLNTLLRNRGR